MIENDPDETEERSLAGASRRKFMVAGAATWASVGLAGCTGDDDDDDADVGNDNDNDDTNTDDNDTEPEVDPNYVVTDDMIAGSAFIPEGTGGFASACAPQRTFVPEMQAVFKIGVWDPATGDPVGPDEIDEAVVDTDLGETAELEWDDEDGEWGGSLVIPEDADPGTVGYTVEVTNDAQFTNVGVLESEFEVIELEDPAANYVVTDDTYAIDTRGDGFAQSCLPQHNFAPDMGVGFGIGVYDSSSGEVVGPDVVDEVVIETETGDTVELEWDEEDGEWGEVWRGIPEDHEGELTYEVQVTNEGEFYRVGVFQDSINVIQP